MSWFDDLSNTIHNSAGGKALQGAFDGLGNAGNYIGNSFGQYLNGDFAAKNNNNAQSAPAVGSADSGAAPMPGIPASQPQTSQPPLSSTMVDAFLHQANSPAMDPALVQQTMGMIQGIGTPGHPVSDYAPVNYLQQAKDAYGNVLSQINGIKSDVNNRYDQVGTDMNDLYKTNQNAMTMGANNILTQLAQGEGNAIQGSAQGNMKALADLKNAQLAQRAAAAQQGGVPQAAGDYKSDIAGLGAEGLLNNAQQGAQNAQAMATQNTNLNNEMASALGNQGAIMHQQLENNRLGYNSSMGKYMADLANQEATREMEAEKQMYQDAMSRVQAGYGIAKDQAGLNIQKNQALFGNKGMLSGLQDVGTWNLDNAKAMAQGAAAGNVDPASTALRSYPQFSTAYNNALANMQLTPGSKPTYADIYKAMYNDPSLKGSNLDANSLANFAQMATANKAMSSPIDDMMLALQGQ